MPLIHFSSSSREPWQALLHSHSAPLPPPPDNNLVIGSIFLLFAGEAKASAALGGLDPPRYFPGQWMLAEVGEKRGGGRRMEGDLE